EKLAVFEYGRTMQLAHQAWRDNNALAARSLLESTRTDLRGGEWNYLHRLCHADLVTLEGHTGGVVSAGFSPDVSAGVTGGRDEMIRLWDARTGAELLALKGFINAFSVAAFSTDGERLVAASKDSTARVWDARTGVELLALKGHDK